MSLSPEEIKMLIQIEQDMEAGIRPYILVDGSKWAFPAEILSAVGLKSGESVSRSVCYQLQLLTLEYLKERLIEEENRIILGEDKK